MRVVSSGSFLAWVVSLTSILALVVYEKWFVPSLGCFFDVVRFGRHQRKNIALLYKSDTTRSNNLKVHQKRDFQHFESGPNTKFEQFTYHMKHMRRVTFSFQSLTESKIIPRQFITDRIRITIDIQYIIYCTKTYSNK